MEEWRPVVGYERYEVSNEGRVRYVSHQVLTPQMGRRRRDYPRVQITVNGRQRKFMVHVLVARAFIGECPAGYEHNHKDGNKRNARADNLEFVTHSQNERHKYETLGYKINQGTRHGMAILNDTAVVAIRAEHAKGVEGQTLAQRFNVSEATISMIVRGRTWRHLLPHLTVIPTR